MKIMFMTAMAAAALISATSAQAAYKGYVPQGFLDEGMDYLPNMTAAQILKCDVKGLTAKQTNLSKAALHEWFGLCAKANPVLETFKANNCMQNPRASGCAEALQADSAIRRPDSFWYIVNAMNGRPDEYDID